MQEMSTKKGKIGELPGMYTIEAAVIVPFLFLITIALLYLGLFYLERAYVISRVDMVTDCAAQSLENDGDIMTGMWNPKERNQESIFQEIELSYTEEEAEIEGIIMEKIKDKLLIFSDAQVSTSISLGIVDTKVKFGGVSSVLTYFGMEEEAFTYEKKSGISNGAEWIRRWQAFE